MEESIVGIIGGTGVTNLPGLVVKYDTCPLTPYGYPSARIRIGVWQGARVAFIERHGTKHSIPPHKVPYKANLAALKSLGVRHVVATCVVGSLREDLNPGTFVIPNQFIDQTWGRDDTFSVDKRLIHLPMAEPYCKTCSRAAADALRNIIVPVRSDVTVVVIQGPRFSTIAEGRMYAQWGGDVINMTQYPECYFARELGLCYTAIGSITDYNPGVSDGPTMTSIGTPEFEDVLVVFRQNTNKTILALRQLMLNHASFVGCRCAEISTRHYYEE